MIPVKVGENMFTLSESVAWMFVGVFSHLLVAYVLFCIRTIRLSKQRPKQKGIIKWKVRFPLLWHMRQTQKKKSLLLGFGTIVVGLFLFFVVPVEDGGLLYALLSCTYLFGSFMISKEFSLHYYIDGNTLNVRSVHNKPYSHVNEEAEVTYNASIQRKHITHVEKIYGGYVLTLQGNQKTLLLGSANQLEKFQQWRQRKNTVK